MAKRTTTTASRPWYRSLGDQPARLVVPRLVLLGAVFVLVALGLVMVFSASAVTGLTQSQNAQGEFVHQFLFTVISTAVAVAVALGVHYKRLVSFGPILVILSVFVLLLTLGVGISANGSTRWISVAGFSIQPSEFAKVFVVLSVVFMMVRVPKDQRLFNPEVWKMMAPSAIVIGLIFVQPDKGTTFVTLIALWVMMAANGYSAKTLMLLAGLGVGVYLLFALKDDYSRARFFTMFDPFADETGNGYQLVHGIFAFASGGIFGRGLGMGVQKYAYLPEAHNDFILAVIGEELGLVGVLFVFLCFGLLAWAGMKIAEEANDLEGRYLAMGCVGLLVGQAALNFVGVLGMAPLTGKAVPFLSAGGSWMLASMGIIGILLNISLRTQLQPTIYEQRRSRFSLAENATASSLSTPVGALGAPHLRLVSSRSIPGAKNVQIQQKHSTNGRISSTKMPSRSLRQAPRARSQLAERAARRERVREAR